MSMDISCKKCSLSIDFKSELFTVCEGDCALHWHATCANLSESDVLALRSNILWLCDDCLRTFRRMQDGRDSRDGVGTVASIGNKKTLEDEVHELKDAVAKIMSTIDKIAPTDSPILHSTPISSSKLLDGTNASGVLENNDGGSRQQCTADGSNFSLLLTNIHTSVDESDIRQMVAQSLDIDDTLDPDYLDVTKLVPRWKSQNSIDFLSFKVVVDSCLKTKAMNPSTWPKGVRFREFVRRRTNTWRPV